MTDYGYRMDTISEKPGYGRKMTAKEINDHPLKRYKGSIQVIKTKKELLSAYNELACEKILGFDTETRPAFKKGISYPPALIQLASSKKVYIFQLIYLKFSGKIREILSNSNIVKAGVAVDFDINQLQEMERFQPEGFVDLSDLAKQSGIKNFGLRGLAAVALGFRISKHARTTNWAAKDLTRPQIQYAATDAWVGREIYLTLKNN